MTSSRHITLNGRAPASLLPRASIRRLWAKAAGQSRTPEGLQDYVMPDALSAGGIAGVVEEFRLATRRALAAGCDGVEVHGSSGYLPEQFLSSNTNQRTDAYGGSAANRALDLAYLYVSQSGSGVDYHDLLRPRFKGAYLIGRGLTRESAEAALAKGQADAAVFGSAFIANPDLPERFRRRGPLNTPDKATYYTSGAEGLIDYPSLTTS